MKNYDQRHRATTLPVSQPGQDVKFPSPENQIS